MATTCTQPGELVGTGSCASEIPFSSLGSETLWQAASLFEDGSSSASEPCGDLHSIEALPILGDVNWQYEQSALTRDLSTNGPVGNGGVTPVGPGAPIAPLQQAHSAHTQTDRLEIGESIRHHMEREADIHPPVGFLDLHNKQNLLTPGIRMIVVSWTVEVVEELRLQQETMHLAVALLDRFLASTQDVPRCVLQLLAVACILLASKQLEVIQPSVEQLCAVTANHFKAQDLLRMERVVLDVLEFNLTSPSSYTFLHLLAQVCSSSVTPLVLSLAMYLCELAVLEYDMHVFTHSCRAASALLLAQLSVGDAKHLPAFTAAVMDMGLSGDLMYACMSSLWRLQVAAYHHALAASAAAAPVGTGRPAEGMQVAELLTPLRVKFGAGCWCHVSLLPPLCEMPAALNRLWCIGVDQAIAGTQLCVDENMC